MAYPSDVDKKKAATQKTPQGQEIPVPKRKEVMDAFRKVAKADKPKPRKTK